MLPEQRAPVRPVGRKTAASGREEKRNKPREYGGQGEKKRLERSEEDANTLERR